MFGICTTMFSNRNVKCNEHFVKKERFGYFLAVIIEK